MSNTLNVTCPKCGAEIALNEAVAHNIREELATEFARKSREQSDALVRREQALAGEKSQLEARAREVDQAVAQRVEQERARLSAAAVRQAEEKLAVELTDLRSQVASQHEQLGKARAAELSLLDQKRKLAEEQESLKLEVARQLDAERGRIAESARQQAVEGERLRLADKESIIKDLQDQIAALQQRAEQGSVQRQGETLELALESDLRQAFPQDQVAEVKKGERGADVMQRVRANGSADCGAILWEAKRAKNWSGSWPEKLKEDQRQAKTELAVLVTTCLPEGMRGFGRWEDVWICEPPYACALAAALRQGLLATAALRAAASGRVDAMARVYDYLCGTQFRQHVEALAGVFRDQHDQIKAEQRAFERQWKQREQQVAQATAHLAGVFGSFQGIAGPGALPTPALLELPGTETTSAVRSAECGVRNAESGVALVPAPLAAAA